VTADLSTREVLPSKAYQSVIEESKRGGLGSLWLSNHEGKSLLQIQLFVYKTYWYLLITAEFQVIRVKASERMTVVLCFLKSSLIDWFLQKITAN
jgi:hypothetical protein